MKKSNTYWHGILVAGLLALTIPAYVYGGEGGSCPLNKTSESSASSAGAETNSKQPTLTEAQSMPTEVSDLRRATIANTGTTAKATESEDRDKK
jgi:hypothetical protein